MPYGCKTQEIKVLQPRGELAVTPPWCITHGRWFAECQGKEPDFVMPMSNLETKPNSEGT